MFHTHEGTEIAYSRLRVMLQQLLLFYGRKFFTTQNTATHTYNFLVLHGSQCVLHTYITILSCSVDARYSHTDTHAHTIHTANATE